MKFLDDLLLVKVKSSMSRRGISCGALMLVAVMSLAACGSKEKKASQSLARVDGEEITVLQLNEELKRANIAPDQQDAARKQLLESLVDRQLIVAEAMRNKIDRTPEVIQAVERAKAQIIAQTYLQGVTTKLAKPSKAEIDDYYQKHPELFAQRKQFDMKSLAIASKDMSEGLKSAMDSAKSLDEIGVWLVKHGVSYMQGKGSRNSAELPPEMAAKLQSLPQGGLFIVNEGEKSLLVSLVGIKEVPVTAKDVAPQIEQYLINKKTKEVLDTEVAHLRSLAKIEYLNVATPVAGTTGGAASQSSLVPENKQTGSAVGNR